MAVPKPVDATLHVALPNGVKLELQGVGLTDLSFLLNDLAALPCSALNRGGLFAPGTGRWPQGHQWFGIAG